MEYFKLKNISKPIINIPGCPMHPDWLVGTLAHVISFGIPELDDLGRPKMFFGRVIHDLCPRRADFENGNFASTFGQPGCLYELGCQGPDTHADCTVRFWNNRTNTCIVAGAPCIGCAAETFAKERDKAFYQKN
jgi:hydrogenase small subunit